MRTIHKRSGAGFSLLELLIVTGAIAIATAMAVPVLTTARNAYQLRNATVDLASLLQRARITCVQQNRAVPVHRAAGNTQVYLDSLPTLANGGPNTQYDVGEPMIQLPAKITALTTATVPIPAPGTLGFNNPQVPPARFDGRGLPCVMNGAVCTNYIAGAGGTQVGFVYYLRQDLGNNRFRWAAVSVTPGGQVKSWFYSSGVWTNR